MKEGYSSRRASKLVGVSVRTAMAWRNGRQRSSGRNEAPLPPFDDKSYANINGNSFHFYNKNVNNMKEYHKKFLTLGERLKIYHYLKLGLSRHQIGLELGRHHLAIKISLVKQKYYTKTKNSCATSTKDG
ncbi:MAG: hypothetical protein LBU89_13205 [Fibromonadaceae bacterium]|nr:hypothetical protein [Fibromonadaceae bacterium]